MRRLSLSAASVLLVLALGTSAFAGWGRGFRVHHHHHHRIGHFGHYGSHWLRRPFYSHHYVHRSYYAPRYYTPSFHFSYGYYPTRYYYAPVRYYGGPYCVTSVGPTYGRYYSWSLADATPTPAPTIVERRPAEPASSWIKLAGRLITEASTRRDDPELSLVSATPAAVARPADKPAAARPLTSAQRIMKLGDDLFRAERYEQALKYYESTGQMTPKMAEAHVRHGQACIATGRYSEAVAAIKRGLDADPAFLYSDFRLQDLYGDETAPTRHVEALAAAALAKADDPDLLFLIGTFLHFEGKSSRAAKFLQRAADLAGDDATHIRLVLYAGQGSAPLRLTSDFSKWSETARPF